MTKKKPGAVRGRPQGSGHGFTEPVGLNLSPEMLAEIDELAERRGHTRSEAMRALLEAALERERKKGAKR